MSPDPYRLPETVRPSHYAIALTLDIENERFDGSVSIMAEIVETTNEIVLNADQLDIAAASIRPAPGDDGAGNGQSTPVATATVEVDAATERVSLRTDEPLQPGLITIDISFSGAFNEQLSGPYLSRFTDDDGNEHTLATTQFEATYARSCFPCWDEPAFKATFQLTLTIDAGHEAVSNSAEVSRHTNDDGATVVTFAPTMIMSTYLVAFVAGPLECSEPIDVNGIPLRVVHVPGKGSLTPFALEAGVFALEYFADYFELPYPGDKLDLIAIPDFAFGAMENLGCVTFREVLLLIDPTKATQSELQRVADVINHEIAHMWFGDLVTMSWWNGLWLNEAFATFMEMRCTDTFRPEWQRWVDFSISRTAAFDTDALDSTRPIEFDVVSPTDAEGMFDILTYEKGAAVVRMLEQYLGEERFRAGIVRYMRENQFANAETTDLWDAIEAETGEPVRRIMDSWIFQGGHPLVSATVDGRSLTLSQERMSYLGGTTTDGATTAGEDADPTGWAVPLIVRWKAPGGDEPRRERLLLDTPDMTVGIEDELDWLVLNEAATGFVRVAYSEAQLDRLADVAIDELEAVERYAVVDDAHAALLAGRSSSIAFLTLIEAMSGEHDRSVWQRLIAGLNQLDRLVDGEARERLAEIAHDVLAPPLANLGLSPRSDDDDRSRQLRGDLVRALGTVANDPEIQEEAKRTVAMGLRDPELIDAALLGAAVDVVASIGDETDFDDFVNAWENAANPQAEIRYLGALADFDDPPLAARFRDLILEGRIRAQNAPFMLARSLGTRDGGQSTWDFIVEEWERLNSLFPTSTIVRMVSGIVRLDRAEQADATEAFFAEHPLTVGEKTLTQLLEKQRVHVALRQREHERLTAFLIA